MATVTSRIDEQLNNAHAPPATAVLEVVDRIAAFSPRGTLSSMMRVSQLWNLAALPHLWGSLDSLLPLVEVAGLLIWRQYQGWAFRGVPSTEDWTRFERHAKSVKSVKHNDNLTFKSYDSLISSTVFTVDLPFLRTIAGGHTPLLPNLAALSVVAASESTLTYLPVVLTAKTDKITLQTDTQRIPSFAVATAFQRLSLMPKLQQLVLYAADHQTQASRDGTPLVWNALENLLRGAVFLTSLALAVSRTTPLSIFSAIGQLPSLTALYLSYTGPATLPPILPSLEALCSPDSHISRLHIAFQLTVPSISFGDICPLFRWSQLKHLRLTDSNFGPFMPAEIAQMGESWPSMTSLIITPPYSNLNPRGTPLDHLSSFASSFPNIRKLAITASIPPDFRFQRQELRQFTQLRDLSLGSTVLPSDKNTEVAEFLAIVCPPATKITFLPYNRGPITMTGKIFEGEPQGPWVDAIRMINMAWRVFKTSTDIAASRTTPSAPNSA